MPQQEAGERVAEELAEFAARTGNTVFVSDFIYSGTTDFNDFTEEYRKALSVIDRKLASVCDRVMEVSFGMVYDYGKAGRR